MATWALYAVDLDTGDVQFLPPTSYPSLPPGGAAGGDLAGTYPNPSVDNVPDAALSANVPLMTAGVLPAVDGSLLTGLPAPATLRSGVGTLDAAGSLDISASIAGSPGAIVACIYGSSGVGPITVQTAPYRVVSLAGAVDSGVQVAWIAY